MIFPYGKEDTDYNIDGNSSSGWVFNGATSVFWCRLRDLLSNEITETFNTVSAECFSATNLINQFDKFQSCYPEEIWRLDVERKYIRTYTGKSVDNSIPKHDTQYLRDMMQGRKKYQRRQWVRDQEMYFGTKYLMNSVVGDNNRITFRCYDPGNDVVVPKNYSLSITPFQDMYVSAMFGNGDQRQIRAKAGETVVLNFSVSTTTDTQVTIYGANRISALNDLSACYIAANNFSMATKLRKLVLGNTTPGYSNPRLTSLTLGSNKLLEELDLRNCGNLTGTLNLAECSNLIKLYADGTRISSITFAINGKVQIAHLPSTLNALVMRNLNDLEDFECSMDYIEQLTLQGGTLNSLEIINDVIDTLEVAYLYDLDWVVPNSSIMNTLYNLSSSTLTGKVYINGSVRIKELEKYATKWPDLTVTYNPSELVTQYVATYVNDDGTELCQIYVDSGSTPPDPVATGEIQTPTKASDAQYTYTFNGWDNIEDHMVAPRTITAIYTPTIRKYTVTWYVDQGLPIKSVEVEYGEDKPYEGDRPTRTDGESTYTYRVFAGWDKSTGYITGDTDVYAIWDTSRGFPQGIPLDGMTPSQIYALGHAPVNIDDYITTKDYKDITVGHDFSFSNVDSGLICSERYFNGSSDYLDTDIKLFDINAESFTLAIDFEFVGTSNNRTLVSCFDENGSEGFRLRYNSGSPSIQWGDKNQIVGASTHRGICVLRHIKGSDSLHVYAFNTSGYSYDDDITFAELVRNRSTMTEMPLVLGAVKASDGGHINYAQGWVHWCKIWYADLGDANARQLAAWPHETWRMEYAGPGERFRVGYTSQYAKISFIANSLLDCGYRMDSDYSNVGGFPETDMYTFLNTRIFNALPTVYQSILRQVSVKSSAGNSSSEIVAADAYIYIPSAYEIMNSSASPYPEEGEKDSYISWFTNPQSRIKYCGITIPDGSRYFNASEDPTTVSSNNVIAGDIWSPSSSNYYIYVPESEASRHSYNIYGYNESITASNGGLWVPPSGWWLRSPRINTSDQFNYISYSGSMWSGGPGETFGIDVCFSV